MDFHATVLEVVMIAGVGAYIGFLIGLRSGVFLASPKSHRKSKKAAASQSSKVDAKEKHRPTVG